jgi:hypothetical protein
MLLRAPGLLLPKEPVDDSDPRTGSLELELAIGVSLMLLIFPITWIHYYLFLAVPLTLLPSWWFAGGLPRPPWLIVLLLLGLFWASGSEVHPNTYYAARDGNWVFRLLQSKQTLGALLLVVGLSFPLAEIARRTRSP